jgi:hypothetical protein
LEVEARRDDVPAPNVSEPVRDPVDNVTESPRRDV